MFSHVPAAILGVPVAIFGVPVAILGVPAAIFGVRRPFWNSCSPIVMRACPRISNGEIRIAMQFNGALVMRGTTVFYHYLHLCSTDKSYLQCH